MMIEAVIFDVDGVIFDSEGLHVKAWERILARRGLVISATDYHNGIGVCDRIFLGKLQAAGKIPAAEDIDRLLAEKAGALLKVADSGATVFPGVKATVKNLARIYRLCAASNSDPQFIGKLLRAHGLVGYFDFVLGRDDVSAPKPSPDVYLLAAAKLGLAPRNCLAIEDSTVGIEAAKRAGMQCCAVTHTTPAERLNQADFILERLTFRGIVAGFRAL